MTPGTRPALAPRARLRWDPARETHVLLAPEGILILNGTGAAILQRCDGDRTVAEIAAGLGQEYRTVVADEVAAFLAQLAARRLVEMHDG